MSTTIEMVAGGFRAGVPQPAVGENEMVEKFLIAFGLSLFVQSGTLRLRTWKTTTELLAGRRSWFLNDAILLH